jgi:hypothetical protein
MAVWNAAGATGVITGSVIIVIQKVILKDQTMVLLSVQQLGGVILTMTPILLFCLPVRLFRLLAICKNAERQRKTHPVGHYAAVPARQGTR